MLEGIRKNVIVFNLKEVVVNFMLAIHKNLGHWNVNKVLTIYNKPFI